MTEQNKTFKIIGDGVMLCFDKAFDLKTKGLKKKLWHFYCNCFQYARCDFDKDLNFFQVYYKDCRAKILNGTVLRYFTTGEGVDVHIHLNGSLISEPKEKFIGCEFVSNFAGLTEIVYNEFFAVNPVKSMTQVIADNAKLKSIIEYGRIDTKYQIETILQEWHNPVPPQYLVGGGATK